MYPLLSYFIVKIIKEGIVNKAIILTMNSIKSSSLSTIVLNSRDWSEIIWLPEISRFKINLAISSIRKKPLECIG